MFSGRDMTELGSFLDPLKIKLLNNAAGFLTPQFRLGYGVSHLSHSARAQIWPYIKETGINLIAIARFYQILENVFGDLDKIATAT